MRRLKTALVLVGILQLAACQPHRTGDTLSDASQDVRSSLVLTLTQAIAIPTGSAFVYFQDTRLLAPEALRPGYPYCRFGLDDRASTVREIEPNAFVVTSIEYDERSAGARGELVSATRMNLQTGPGAKGYHMTCMLPASAGYARAVTVPEIQGAVGTIFTLKPAY